MYVSSYYRRRPQNVCHIFGIMASLYGIHIIAVTFLLHQWSHAAEITVNTTGFTYKFVEYDVKQSTSIVFKVKGSAAECHVGLFSDKNLPSQLNGHQYYEVFIGGWTNTITGIRNVGSAVSLASFTGSNFISDTEYKTYWVSWENLMIAIGHGSEVGANTIVSADGSGAPREINYLAFSSYGGFTHSWKYNNVDLLLQNTGTQMCSPSLPIPVAPLSQVSNKKVNDNDPSTCVQITTTMPSIYLQMLIRERLPVKVKLQLKSVPSCENSGIMVFSTVSSYCPLLSEATANGVVTCVYDCTTLSSPKITLGFVRPQDRPPVWLLCEVTTV